MFGKNPNNINNPPPKRFYYKKTWFSGVKIPRWKLSLGLAGVVLMLVIVLFSNQIGDLLSLFGLRAAGPDFLMEVEPPVITLGPDETTAVYEVRLTPVDPIAGIVGAATLSVIIDDPNVVSTSFDLNPVVFDPSYQATIISHLTIVTSLPHPLTETIIDFAVMAGGPFHSILDNIISMIIKTDTARLVLEGQPSPDFSILVAPKNRTIYSGDATSYTVTLTSLNGFAGDVMLTSPDLVGITGSYLNSFNFSLNPVPLVADEVRTIDLDMTSLAGLTDMFNINFLVIGTAVTGTPPVTIEHSDSASLTILPVQDYKITVTNTPQTKAPGETATYPITIERINGFTEAITLTSDLVLPHASISKVEFSSTIINVGDPTPTISLTANIPTPDATVNFIVFGNVDNLNDDGPAMRQSAGMMYIVNAVDYTLEVTPPAISVFAGDTAVYTVTIHPLNGFNEPVQLTDNVLTNFGTYVESVTYDANPITVSTSMRIKTKPGVTHPGFDFTVTGTSQPSGIIRFDMANLAIGVTPDYSISIDPLLRIVAPGQSAQYTVTLTRIGGFTSDVNLVTDLATQPGVESAIFNPVMLTGGNLVSTLTVTAKILAANADYPFVVDGRTLDLQGVPAIRYSEEAHFVIQSTADFFITIEAPKSQTVAPGGVATYHILLTRLNGYRETVTLTHDLISPFVASAIFDDNTMEDGDNDAYLTVTATDPADAISLPFIVTGTGLVEGIMANRTDNAVFAIQNMEDYQISINPDSRTVAPGGVTTYDITLTRMFSFTGNVTLTTDLTSKAGVQSAVFNPLVLSGGTLVSTLTVTAQNPTANASHIFIVYGDTPLLNGVPARRTDTATLNIVNTPDFNIAVIPPSITIAPGQTAVYDVNLQIINGYTNTVTLSDNLIGTYGAWLSSATYDSSTLSPASPSTKLRVTAKLGIGNQDIIGFIVTGNGLVGGVPANRTDTADLLIRNPYDYSIAIDPNSRTVAPGGNTTYDVTLTRNFGFTGAITLTTNLGAMTGVSSAILNPIVLTGGNLTSTLTVIANNPALDANHLFTVFGDTPMLNTGPATRTAQATFIIENNEDFTVSITPKTKQIAPSGTALYNITANRVNGFNGNITLTNDLVGEPGILSALFTDPILNSGETATTLTVVTTGNISTSDIPFLIFGSGSPEGIPTQRQDNATLSIVDFTISITPNSRTIVPGQSTSYTVNLVRLNGFTGTVDLTTDLGTKSYISSALFADTALGSGQNSTTLNVITTGPAPDTDINFIVTGNSTVDTITLSHQTGALLRLITLTIPDFTITVTPKTRTVNAGESTTYDVLMHRLNGFAESVTLSNDLLTNYGDYIASATFGWDILPGGNTDITTTLYVTSKVISGNIDVPFTVTGKETVTGLPEHSDTATLSIVVEVVTPPSGGGGGGGSYTPPAPTAPETPTVPTTGGGEQDYTITVDALTDTTIHPGQSATYLVTIYRIGSFDGPVDLTTDVLQLNPDVASATFTKTTIPAGETTTQLVLIARPNTVIDSRTVFNVQGFNTSIGERKDDDKVAIVVPPQLPSTGPAPTTGFWLWLMFLLFISWEHAFNPKAIISAKKAR